MDTGTLSNQHLSVEYATRSLRICGFTPRGGKNLLADLSAMPAVPTPYGDFSFKGGHRLWHAPESMPRTYIPDDTGLHITQTATGVILETPQEPLTNIRKRIELVLETNAPRLTLRHALINDSLWPVTLAPWGITQFRTGGTVIMPLQAEKADLAGLLPNRQIAFWQYTDPADQRLRIRNSAITFAALPVDRSFKIGTFTPHGWLAYAIDGMLFTKTFGASQNGNYPDQNCNAEIYGCADFVELESLGAMQVVEPGGTAEHTEMWELHPNLDWLPANIRGEAGL